MPIRLVRSRVVFGSSFCHVVDHRRPLHPPHLPLPPILLTSHPESRRQRVPSSLLLNSFCSVSNFTYFLNTFSLNTVLPSSTHRLHLAGEAMEKSTLPPLCTWLVQASEPGHHEYRHMLSSIDKYYTRLETGMQDETVRDQFVLNPRRAFARLEKYFDMLR